MSLVTHSILDSTATRIFLPTLATSMKVCANIASKHGRSSDQETQILPHSLQEGDAATDTESGVRAAASAPEDCVENSLFILLAFIVCVCLVGTFVSIGGVLMLKNRSQFAHFENQTFYGVVRTPAAAPLLQNPIHPLPRDAKPTRPVLTAGHTAHDVHSDLHREGDSESGKSAEAEASSATEKSETRGRTFLAIGNQWSLEQAPSARQLLQAAKQFFSYFRSGIYGERRV